ncbi:unnamed protein product [Microthlaspi erraticum]|uniref:Uncharacterized protein n=1 Tax=Microthlaspi erraticum TaxID=1685480 RepID=A0A6D2LGH8_9BRAS|nr:unnamed protein product [Microthlaspi erraticum]
MSHEFNIEKLQLVEAEKKIRQEYEKEKQDVKRKICEFACCHSSRIKVLQVQYDIVNTILEEKKVCKFRTK